MKKTKHPPKKAMPSVFIYAPDESLKKKLGIGKKLSQLITPTAVKKAAKQTQKTVAKQASTHGNKIIKIVKKPNRRKAKK